MTIHSWRNIGKFSALFQKCLLSRAKNIACVNEDIKRSLNLINSVVLHAFIPPDIRDESEMPSYLTDWVSKRKKAGDFVISSNAYRLVKYNGCDLYGLDLALAMVEELSKRNVNSISMVYNVANLNSPDLLFEKYSLLADSGVLKNKFLLTNEKELSFVKLIGISDATLRATNTDGDALSVRESLYFGKPVIASDVVERPKGTQVFHSRDLQDLSKVVDRTISEHCWNKQIIEKEIDYETIYKGFYKVL